MTAFVVADSAILIQQIFLKKLNNNILDKYFSEW